MDKTILSKVSLPLNHLERYVKRYLSCFSFILFGLCVLYNFAELFLLYFCVILPSIIILKYKSLRGFKVKSFADFRENYNRINEDDKSRGFCLKLCLKLKANVKSYKHGHRFCPKCKVFMMVVSKQCPCCSAELRFKV